MRRISPTRKAIEYDLACSMAADFETDERLARAAARIAEAEAAFRKLAEPRLRE